MTPDAELLARWRERDRLYPMRRYMNVLHPLSENEVAAIREHREREARALSGNARLISLAHLATWAP